MKQKLITGLKAALNIAGWIIAFVLCVFVLYFMLWGLAFVLHILWRGFDAGWSWHPPDPVCGKDGLPPDGSDWCVVK